MRKSRELSTCFIICSNLGPLILSMESQFEVKKKTFQKLLNQIQTKEFELNDVLRVQIESLERELENITDSGTSAEVPSDELGIRHNQLAKQLSKVRREMKI